MSSGSYCLQYFMLKSIGTVPKVSPGAVTLQTATNILAQNIKQRNSHLQWSSKIPTVRIVCITFTKEMCRGFNN